MKIIFYYNDNDTYEAKVSSLQEATAVESGVLRALYSKALASPENFKKSYVVGYELRNDKGELVDNHIY